MSAKPHKDHIGKLYEEHSDAIFRYIFFKISDREKALDITHDTFVKVWDSMSGGTVIDNHKAYLYRTAERLVIDWYRKKKSLSLDSLQEDGFDVGVDSTAEMAEKIDAEVVTELIKELEDDYKNVIILRYLEEMSVKDIALALGEKENTISVRIYRALEKLRIILDTQEKRGIEGSQRIKK